VYDRGESPARRSLMLNTMTPAGVVTFLEACSRLSPCLPSPQRTGETRSGTLGSGGSGATMSLSF
jgi:hypothetical protein